MAEEPADPFGGLESWTKLGAYRVLEIGLADDKGDKIEWDGDDKEFKHYFEGVRAACNMPRRALGTVARRAPRVKVAILDCGIDDGVYFCDRVRGSYESPTADNSKGSHAKVKIDLANKERDLDQLQQELSEAQGDPEVKKIKTILAKREVPGLEEDIKDLEGKENTPQAEPETLAAKRKRLATIGRALGLSQLRTNVRECTRDVADLELRLRYAKPGAHGTMCGGRAAWGCDNIEVLDVKLQYGNATGNNNMKEWVDALRWAVEEKKADIVSCSVTCNFDKLEEKDKVVVQDVTIADYIRKHPETLFVLSAGNDAGYIAPPGQARGKGVWAPAHPNVLLVSGCTRKGKLHTISRWGQIDLWTPSCYYHQYKPNGALVGGGAPNNKKTPLDLPNAFGVSLEGVETDERPRKNGAVPNSVPDFGVSFAVPIVANVAAKCKLLDSALDGKDLARLLTETARTTQTVTPNAKPPIKPPMNQKIRVRMMSPVDAYEKAAQIAMMRAATTGVLSSN